MNSNKEKTSEEPKLEEVLEKFINLCKEMSTFLGIDANNNCRFCENKVGKLKNY